MTNIERLYQALASADGIAVGAGAGLSTAAGFTYSGERFEKYFADFIEKYGFNDMYTAGFFNFQTEEEKWAYWSRHIYYNRYVPAPKPCHQKTYDNEEIIRKMITAQVETRHGTSLRIPSELVPHCPICGGPMSVNYHKAACWAAGDRFTPASTTPSIRRRVSNFVRSVTN